jgi:hypothetical protein
VLNEYRQDERHRRIKTGISLASVIGETVALRRCGRLMVALCPFHEEKTPSFYVYADHYHCFGCGAHGNVITWLTNARGLPFREALTHLGGTSTQRLEKVTAPSPTRPPREVPNGDADARQRLDRAARIWRDSGTVLGSPAANYLNSRGIENVVTCSDLRFNADCPHPTSTLDRPVRLPALVAAVRGADGRLAGVHRTYLRRDGSGKAQIDPQKASLGPVRGAAVRLAPLEQVLDAGEVVLAEGIESAASAALLLDLPGWAALNATNLAGIVLPRAIQRVLLAADHDRAGLDAARVAWSRLHSEGRTVRIAVPTAEKMDFADVLASRATP